MIRRFVSLSAARLVAVGVQAVALIVVARFVSVDVFGEVSVILAALTVVFVASSAGLPAFILRERALGDNAAVRAGLRANIVTSLVVGLAVASVGAVIVRHDLLGLSLVLLVAVGVDKTIDGQLSVPIADGRSSVAVASILGRALLFAGAFALALALDSERGALAAYVVARGVAAAGAVAHILLVRTRVPDAPLPTRLLVRRIGPLAGANLVSALRSLDSALVFLVGGSAAAGLYSAASRPFAPASIVAGAAGTVLMPHSATADWATLLTGMQRLQWLTVAATVAVAPLAFFGEPVAVLLYGERYAAAGPALGVCLLAVPAVISAAAIATVLQARGLERFVLVNSAVFLAVFVVAVVVGTLLGSSTGAAIGFAVSVWARNVGLAWGMRLLRVRESE
jgi:O-antigen/teichoic acid export membrane protein